MKNEKMKLSVESLNGGTVESAGNGMNIEQPVEELEYDTVDPMSAARKGKIAALSRNVRESLNRRMRRGEPGPDVLEWLNAEPVVVELLAQRFEGKPITRQNLWEW